MNPRGGKACKTCRRGGRACDKRLPECGRCIAKGKACERYDLGWPGVASRGRLRGLAIPVVVDKKKSQSTCLKGSASLSSSEAPRTAIVPIITNTSIDHDTSLEASKPLRITLQKHRLRVLNIPLELSEILDYRTYSSIISSPCSTSDLLYSQTSRKLTPACASITAPR